MKWSCQDGDSGMDLCQQDDNEKFSNTSCCQDSYLIESCHSHCSCQNSKNNTSYQDDCHSCQINCRCKNSTKDMKKCASANANDNCYHTNSENCDTNSGHEHDCGHDDRMLTASGAEDKMVSSDSDYFSFTAQEVNESKLNGKDATSSGEAVNLQSKLRSLSTELTTLRTRINQDTTTSNQQITGGGDFGGSAPNVVAPAGSSIGGGGNPPPPLAYYGNATAGGYNDTSLLRGGMMPPPQNHHLSERYLNSTSSQLGERYMNGTMSLHTSMQDNFSTLRSTKSDMTGILQHNYSNIQAGHSFHSNLSQASGPSFPTMLASQPPPPPSSQPPLPLSLPPAPSQYPSPPPPPLNQQQTNSLPPTQYPFNSASLPSLTPMELQQNNIGQAVGSQTGGGRPPERPRTPPEVRQKRRDRSVLDEARKSRLSEISDLIRLEGPLTEDAVLKTLQARYYSHKYQTNIGPILVHVNPCTDLNNPITLNSTTEAARTSQLRKVAEEAIRIQGDTGYPQAIILSGACGSGKTYASMVLLRQLFDIAGGGPETDAFKHLAAAFTVLRSLGSAKTASNRESSRIGHFIEVQVSGGALYRTKIHCYFLDQSRVIRLHPTEKNYHIFYQLMAGLNPSERRQLGLQGYTIHDLRYLNSGDTRTDEHQDRERFKVWKNTLGILGIPYMDVLRVLAAILLLGNLEFIEGEGLEVEVVGKSELQAVSNLLGVSTQLLVQGLTTKTHNVRGQLVKSSSDANMSNATRDAVAKALYCRTVATIVKRANSLKKPIGSGSLSSNESVHHEVASLHASTVGTAGSKKSSKSLAILNNALRHATDGFVGVLDMFGFEDSKPSHLEQLCINLCSETMQHFFNTHTLKTSIETCREEGIHCDVIVDYNDNAHCIDLISSLRTGLLKMLDVECSVRGCPETYVQKVKVQHKDNTRLYEPNHCDITRTFGIKHYAGKVVYDTTNFLDTNRDVIPDDLVSIFHKESCSFGFVTHLFGTEIKALYSEDIVPRGITFRISPTSYSDLLNGDEPVSTLTQDFHTRLDNLLRTLVHAKPHFVRCIRPNENDSSAEFSRGFVVQQVRALQILETVNLMAGGYPHRMRFKNFNARYRMLAAIRSLSRSDELALADCKAILEYLKELLNFIEPDSGSVSMEWALGRKHIFLSEGIRQRLEKLRSELRNKCAVKIQAYWRGYFAAKRWPGLRASLLGVQQVAVVGAGTIMNPTGPGGIQRTFLKSSSRPRPQPISGTPPPDSAQNGMFLSKSRPQYPDPPPVHNNQHRFNAPNSTKNQNNAPLQMNGGGIGVPTLKGEGSVVSVGQHSNNGPDSCDLNTIQRTCSLFGLDLERPPPVPPSRPYTVRGNSKISYPQSRFMRKSYPEETSGESLLLKGENVVVIGASTKRGHLVVEKNNTAIHVPFQFLQLSSQG